MSLTLNSWVARSTEMALVGVANDARFEYLRTAEMLAETLIPQVAQAAARDAAGDPQRFQQFIYEHTISFTNSVGAIPANLLSEYWDLATFLSTANPTWAPKISWIRWYRDFISGPDTRLGYFCESPAGVILFVPPGTTFVPGGTNWSGSLTVLAISSPPIPSNPSTAIDVQEEAEDSLVTALASALTGQAAWQAISDRIPVGVSG